MYTNPETKSKQKLQYIALRPTAGSGLFRPDVQINREAGERGGYPQSVPYGRLRLHPEGDAPVQKEAKTLDGVSK